MSRSQKFIVLLLTLLTIVCMAAAAFAEASLTFSETDIVLAKGKTSKLTVTVSDADLGKSSKTTWSSSDSKVASVSGGTVTAKSSGQAVITCTKTWKDGTTLTATANVDVYVPVSKLTMSGKTLVVNVGSSKQLSAAVAPETARYQTVTWSSSDPQIAAVDENGTVTGKAIGKATITATSTEPGKKAKTTSCSVTVNQGAKTLTISSSETTIAKGKSVKLTATVGPDTTTKKAVTWTSSNPSVATVSKTGQITAKSTGSCTITVATTDGSELSATCKVTVIQAVKKVTPSTTKRILITKGKSTKVRTTITPSDATNKSLVWTSSNTRVATVDNGTIKGVSTGECVITATAADGSGASASFKVCIEPDNPVTIESISTYWYYYRDWNCLFVKPYNHCKYRKVKTFRFDYTIYNSSGKALSTGWCEWSKGGFRSFGPHQYGKSGSWHWYGIDYLTTGSKIKITVNSVTFTDGTTEYTNATSSFYL